LREAVQEMERMDAWVLGSMVLLLWGIALPAWKIGLEKRRRNG
jgi:hypothetical protein